MMPPTALWGDQLMEQGMGCQTVGFAHPRLACLPSPALGKLKPTTPARESSLLAL